MKTAFTGKNYSITVADGTETINGNDCYSGQLIITHPQGTEVFDTFQELVEAHPVCEEAREYSVYRVASHNRNNSPDDALSRDAWYSDAYNTGFEACIQGEPREDNPYHIDAFSRDAWYSGWDDAK